MFKRKKPVKKSTGYRSAANQERVWEKSALDESISEGKRAKKYRSTNPQLASELEWDSKIAYLWYGKRDKRAKRLENRARNLVKRGK
jgi:hypothetical protein